MNHQMILWIMNHHHAHQSMVIHDSDEKIDKCHKSLLWESWIMNNESELGIAAAKKGKQRSKSLAALMGASWHSAYVPHAENCTQAASNDGSHQYTSGPAAAADQNLRRRCGKLALHIQDRSSIWRWWQDWTRHHPSPYLRSQARTSLAERHRLQKHRPEMWPPKKLPGIHNGRLFTIHNSHCRWF